MRADDLKLHSSPNFFAVHTARLLGTNSPAKQGLKVERGKEEWGEGMARRELVSRSAPADKEVTTDLTYLALQTRPMASSHRL